MKDNKTIYLMAMALLLLTVQNSWGFIGPQNKKVLRGKQVEYSPSKNNDAEAIRIKTEGINCDHTKQMLAKSELETLFGDDIQWDWNPGTKQFIIYLPRYASNCFDIDIKLDYDSKTNSIYIEAYNQKDLSKEYLPVDGEKNKNVLHEERIEKCMEGIYDEKQKPTDKIKYTSFTIKPFSFSIPLDKEKDMNLYFSTPKHLGGHYPISEEATSIDVCNFAEPMLPKDERPLFKSPRLSFLEEVESTCATGKPEEIFKLMGELRDVGNAPKLNYDTKKILQMLNDGLEKSVDKEVKIWNKQLIEIGKSIRKAETQDMAEELANKYSDILEKLEKYYIKPRINEIEKLYEKRKITTDTKKEKELQAKIDKYADEIMMYSKYDKYISKNVIRKLNSLGIEADTIFEFRLKSKYFSQLGAKKKKKGFPIFRKEIERKIEKELKKYEKHAAEKIKQYGSRHLGEKHADYHSTRARGIQDSRATQLKKLKKAMHETKQLKLMCQQTQNNKVCNNYKKAAKKIKYLERKVNRLGKSAFKHAKKASVYQKLEEKYTEEYEDDEDEEEDSIFDSFWNRSSYDYDIDVSSGLWTDSQNFGFGNDRLYGGNYGGNFWDQNNYTPMSRGGYQQSNPWRDANFLDTGFGGDSSSRYRYSHENFSGMPARRPAGPTIQGRGW